MSDTTPSRNLHYGLWAMQALLALSFVGAGAMKLTTPDADLLAAGMTWVERFPGNTRYLIGSSEVLGAIGLILPAATGIQPKLTGIAAAALTLVMVIAAGDHLIAGEAAAVGAPIVLGGLSAFVAWGRLVAAPPQARS